MTVQISIPGSSSLARATDNPLMLAYVWEISHSITFAIIHLPLGFNIYLETF